MNSEPGKRTTVDLIEELDHEAGNFTRAALAVGFEHTTIYVFATDDERLDKLNRAVEAGGEPIGLVGWDMHHSLLTVQARPLEEYAGEDWGRAISRRPSGWHPRRIEEGVSGRDQGI